MSCSAYDPLAAERGDDDPRFDVALWGTVFLDIIFTGLDDVPSGGTEVAASGMGSCPGGIANLAVAASRLGLRTTLAAAFAMDSYADFCWETLEDQESVNLCRSRRYDGWHSPVTVSYAIDGDRSMITHSHLPRDYDEHPVLAPPPARAVIADLGSTELGRPEGAQWLRASHDNGTLVFADLGWDTSGRWRHETLDHLECCYAFTPNAAEAMAYSRTDTPQDALYAIADRVPLAVVTNGPHGALAIDSATGEEVSVPALRVPALDATGCGDVFAAALVLGTLAQWPLPERVAFATLCSSLAVQQFGGSLAAPGWGDIARWWHDVRDSRSRAPYDLAVRRRYGFLDGIVPTMPQGAVHRAAATLARRADVGVLPPGNTTQA